VGPEARGALYGLSRKSGPAEISRAALEAVGYRPVTCSTRCGGLPAAEGAGTVLRVDGGMTASDYTLQFLADMTDAPVDRRCSWKRPRSVPPIWRPQGRVCPIWKALRRPGSSIADSSRAWTRKPATANARLAGRGPPHVDGR